MITEASAAPTLCAAVVVHESCTARLESTLRALAGALRRAAAGGALGGAEVVVRDNASTESYRDRLRGVIEDCGAEFGAPLRLQLSLSSDNAGYGAGVNAAVCGRSADYLLVLNPDLDLAQEALLAGLLHLQRSAAVAALGPRCRGSDGQPEYLCKRYPALLDLLLRGLAIGPLQRRFAERLARYEYRDRPADAVGEVTLLSGACMLMRREVFDRVGGFDPGFFMYFEDFDLSLRLARGGSLLYEPAMEVVHHGGYASRKGWRHIRWFIASALRFYRRNGWRWL